MPHRDRRRACVAGLLSVAALVSACGVAVTPARAADTAPALAPGRVPAPPTQAGRPPADDETLLLEVVVNGQSTGKVAEVIQRQGMLLVKREDLGELGLRVAPGVAPLSGDLYSFASLPNVSVRVDQATQTLYVTAAVSALLPEQLQVAGAQVSGAPLESATGLTLNYDVNGTATGGHYYGSGLFDLRAFSPFGVASTDFLAFAGPAPGGPGKTSAIRLDSTFVHSDFDSQRRYWLGDFITGGLTWTRPVRLGGAQITADFTMRPDLVTFPTPIVTGSAAVPSTVDVLVNGSRTLSQQIQPGPFEVPQLPVVTGAGQVQVTVTNALGQQVTSTQPFYASPTLLSAGLDTYALDAGFVRRNWGVLSNDYGDFAASGTYRRGLNDYLTIEAHAEGTNGQFMGGGGLVANAFNLAVVDLSGAASTADGRTGGQLAASLQRIGQRFSFGASAVLATPEFRDIAAMNGDPAPTRQITADVSAYLGKWGTIGAAWLEVNRPAASSLVGLTGPPAFAPPGGPAPPSTVGLGNGGLPFLPAQTSRQLTASYSVQLFGRAFLYATGFHDFANGGSSGAYLGITIPLGSRSSVSASGNYQDGSHGYGQVQVQQSAVDIGDFGYQGYVARGGVDHEFGQLQYKSSWNLLTAGIDQFDSGTTGRVQAQGGLSLADGGVFASNTVTDSFAVVDTNGFGGVHALYENRPAGQTDDSGRLLVPDLRSWDVNRLAIDPGDVPVDAQVPYATRTVRPPDRSGVVVKFPIRKTNGALLVLVDEAGQPLPTGSVATLQATGTVATVGYDGEAFIEGLAQQNQVIVQLPNGSRCAVSFNFAPAPGEIPKLGPLTCIKNNL
ncbi:MAG TPA: fimbria/pilus outer membrane usher protein [Rhizomicrobium sp.]|nr:fimbria/pilus outer membrane usher protein [Rhizomicrobium sp.]